MKLPKIEQEKEPEGKRSYRWNVHGNFVCYIGRKRWIDFAREADAIEWVNKKSESNQ